jgi:uncharacterized protein (DUF58 family)
VTFRPSPLAYALAVVVAWLACLAIGFGRAELVFIAVPLVWRLVQSLPPAGADIAAFVLASDGVAPSEGDVFTLTVDARLTAATGLVQVLPALPGQVGTNYSTAAFSPQPDGRVRWGIPLLCRFGGMLDFGTVFFRQWDRSGLWVGEARRDQPVSLAVRPMALAIRTVPSPRLTGAPFGVHASQKFGDGSDFADIRIFAPGDRMKRINWPVSLRMRQLHVNQFHVERSADVILLVDTFVIVGQRPHSTLDFALRAAAGLAQAYLRQTDRVGLIEVGGWLRWTRPASGPRQYETILQSLTRVTVAETDLRRNAPDLPEAMLPRHALIIALTPLADERFIRVVTGLADQGRDVVLLAIGGDEVSLPYLTRRAGHPVVRQVWRLLQEDRLRELRRHGMRTALWSPPQPIEGALASVERRVTRRAAWFG